MGNENKINNVTIALPTERPPKQLTDRPIIKTYKVASLIRISQVIASLKRNDGIDYHSLISFNLNTLNIFDTSHEQGTTFFIMVLFVSSLRFQ